MNLSDELKSTPPELERGQGLEMFLAQRSEIKQAIVDGYSSARIWKHLHDKGTMPIQYRQFARYVDRYITSKETTEQLVKASSETNQQPVKKIEKSNSSEPKQLKEENDLTRRFTYDAKGKSADELI